MPGLSIAGCLRESQAAAWLGTHGGATHQGGTVENRGDMGRDAIAHNFKMSETDAQELFV
jgi:hypothetical protein